MYIEVDVLDEEVLQMMARVQEVLAPRKMALVFSQRLLEKFREQIKTAFDAEGPGWPALSQMRVDARGGSRNPILYWSGSFQDEVSRYKGTIKLREVSFDFDFPGDRETSGRYWGLTAGQLVNPLGMRPLAQFPRPILAGATKQQEDSVLALAEYFEANGWEVEIG